MFSTEIITPQQLTYVQAEKCSQHARRVVKKCDAETLRLIRAKLADLYGQHPKDSQAAEIIMIRGAIVQQTINANKVGNRIANFVLGSKRRWAEEELCIIRT